MNQDIAPLGKDDPRKAHLEVMRKLARITAALGIAGDEPVDKIENHARKLVADRTALLAAAGDIAVSTQQSNGLCWVLLPAWKRLMTAIEDARKDPS